MEKELNLQSVQESKMITNIIEQALTGITKKEIIELRKVCSDNRYDYYSRIKLKYITGLGMLGINFRNTQEIEETIFFLIHDIVHKITITEADDLDSDLIIQIA